MPRFTTLVYAASRLASGGINGLTDDETVLCQSTAIIDFPVDELHACLVSVSTATPKPNADITTSASASIATEPALAPFLSWSGRLGDVIVTSQRVFWFPRGATHGLYISLGDISTHAITSHSSTSSGTGSGAASTGGNCVCFRLLNGPCVPTALTKLGVNIDNSNNNNTESSAAAVKAAAAAGSDSTADYDDADAEVEAEARLSYCIDTYDDTTLLLFQATNGSASEAATSAEAATATATAALSSSHLRSLLSVSLTPLSLVLPTTAETKTLYMTVARALGAFEAEQAAYFRSKAQNGADATDDCEDDNADMTVDNGADGNADVDSSGLSGTAVSVLAHLESVLVIPEQFKSLLSLSNTPDANGSANNDIRGGFDRNSTGTDDEMTFDASGLTFDANGFYVPDAAADEDCDRDDFRTANSLKPTVITGDSDCEAESDGAEN